MNRIFLYTSGTTFELYNIPCQMCGRPASVIITPKWTHDFYVCEDCRSKAIRKFNTQMPTERN